MNRKSPHTGNQSSGLILKLTLAAAILLLGIGGVLYFSCLSPDNLLALLNWPGRVNVAFASTNSEWTQEAHDAQRTGFTQAEPPEPWRLAWSWNGPDANGGTGGHSYNAPPEAHTVTGGDFVYVPAGAAGLYALRKSDGRQAWHVASPAFNATPAYDPLTGDLFAGGADGSLYKLDGQTGAVLGTYAAGDGLNKAVLLVGSSAYILTDSGELHRVDTLRMSRAWMYAAGSAAATPAAYSANAGLVIYCTADLYVQAVRASDGAAQWRVKPTNHPAQAPYTFAGYWPVVAEQHGLVFMRLNLGADALWSGTGRGTSGGGVYPLTNAATRSLLQSNDGALENLFALNLSDGSQKFIPAVGYGGVEYRPDGSTSLYLQSGPPPVVKVLSDGSEVAYIPFRSGQGSVPDGRWDTHMGEMVLDSTTLPGLAAGDLRFVDFPNSYVNITDEQTPFSMAGNTLFHAHWGASESTTIIDRSAGKGLSAAAPISSKAHPAVIRRQQACPDFNPATHQTSCGLALFGDGRNWNGPGFWVYWNTYDPPTRTNLASYSDGLLPRYTYASDGLIVVEGNGGELTVLRDGDYPDPTATPTVRPSPSAAPISTPALAAVSTRPVTLAGTQTLQPVGGSTQPAVCRFFGAFLRHFFSLPAQTANSTAAPTPQPSPSPTVILSPSPTASTSQGRIGGLKVLTTAPGVFDRFEVQFNLQTAAQNPDVPFDSSPPPGVMAGIGVTVSGLFSADNWKTTLTQPAFLYQPYTHTVDNGKDHFIPSGPPVWDVRFAPQSAGAWQYRLSVQDSQGLIIYPDLRLPALTFNVGSVSANPNTVHGFLRVSPTDSRYFQFQDGTPFVGVGFNDGFTDSQSVEQKMTAYQQNGMNFMRVWLSGSGINGSQWTSWASNFIGQDSYLPGTSFDIANTFNGGPVSLRLDDTNPCLFADFWQGGVPVEPNTTYTVSARVKVSGVSGPAAGGADYGFVIKQGGWLATDCAKSATGVRITAPVTGSTDWITVTGSYKTGPTDSWLGNLYLARENASAGQVSIDEVHFYRSDDPAKVDLLRQPYANATEHFDPLNAAQWDLYIQSAEQHGVYLKLVIDEKNEWIRNHMGADGRMTLTGSNDNFYAAPGTKVRWLEQAWWRYIIARWGYSPAVHSFEYINEGDPYDGHLYEATEAMASYFHQNDPSHPMVTTSFWNSFPNAEFWSNPKYADVDYADLHAYISTGWGLNAAFLPANMLETRPAYVHSGAASAVINGAGQVSASIVPRGLVIQGPGEWVIKYWMKAEGLSASCPYAGNGSMLRIRWTLDGGTFNGGSQGVVPANSQGKDFVCTSPAGTFDWKQFSSTADQDGTALPAGARIVLADSQPHELNLLIENSSGTGGTAWIDDVQLINPSGQVQPVIGQFDTTPLDEDTAWYNQAYGEVFGGGSLVGAHKPLVRGETGIDFVGNQNFNPDLLKDTQGIWLHNNLWGQVNDSGMADLFWWASETIPTSIYSNFLTFRNFMAGIPLANGHYRDSGAQASNDQLKVIGQRDDTHGQMHLWVQNVQHTWKRVVNGPAVTAASGTISIPNVAAGSYKVEWWNTYATSNPIFLTQTVQSNGTLVLTLPAPLADDLGIKIYKIP